MSPRAERGVTSFSSGELRDALSYFGRAASLVWKSAPRSTIAYMGLTAISAGLPWFIALAAKRIVDAVIQRDHAHALVAVWTEFGLVAAQLLTGSLLFFVQRIIGSRLGLDINLRILERAKDLALTDFEDPDTYDRMTRARREASSRPLDLLTGGISLLKNSITFAGYAWILMDTRAWAVALLVAATIPATLLEIRHSKEGFKLRSYRSPESRKLLYYEHVLSNDQYSKEVKVFGLGDFFLARYRELGEMFFADDRRLLTKRIATSVPLSVLSTLSTYGLYAFVVGLTAAGKITLGNMTLYVLALRQGQASFASALTALGNIYEHNLYMSNLFEFLDPKAPREADATLDPPGSAVDLPVHVPGGESLRWKLEDVGFRYPGKETFALRHVTLDIGPGERLALVGENGAGKSTFVKLMLGLYEPTEGRILLGGKDLRTWDREELHKLFGVVFQDYNRYHLALRENVGVGRLDAMADDERVNAALVKGGADPLLGTLKDGLNSTLGRWFRDGAELSGGQWQRVALSRAFMRTEAPFLILDEPSAALDAEAEHALFKQFQELSEGKMTIIISHRFPTVRMAHRILVIQNGEIAEEGSHEALMKLGGRYAGLFNLQASGYLS